MLKYYEYLLRIRSLVRAHCGMEILSNLESFPVDLDPSLREYHQKIAARIEAIRSLPADQSVRSRYYIHKVRPFFADGHIYYEVTFSNARNKVSKFDRIIAFTDIDITDRYAANLTLHSDSIAVLGHTMPVTIIRAWEVSIRPCEIDNFARILGQSTKVGSRNSEYQNLMKYLTESRSSLLDLVDMPDPQYSQMRVAIIQRTRNPLIFPWLDKAREIARAKAKGHNVLRYLMLQMNNRLIKQQFDPERCNRLSPAPSRLRLHSVR